MSLKLIEKLEQLAEQEAILNGKETGIRILIEFSPDKVDELAEELKKIHFERVSLQACLQLIKDYMRSL